MKTPEALQMTQFASPQQQLVLTVLHTASAMMHRHRTVLKPHGITPEQFNILRILRGQKGRPLPLREITQRMIDRNSNTSRLVDKLVDKGHVAREICPKDRRRVDIVLTQGGAALTEELKNIMDQELSLLAEVWPSNQTAAACALLDAWNETQP